MNSGSGCADNDAGDELPVPASADGQRLDLFLQAAYADRSRAFIQRCVRQGKVLLNGEPTRPAVRVKTADRIRVQWPPPETSDALQAEKVDFGVIFEDDDILVINKPPGVVIHPTETARKGTLVHGLLHHDETTFRDMVDEYQRPGIVHRLDKDTTGVLVIAKNLEARRRLKDAFKLRSVEKTYLTLVLGDFGAITGRIDTLIGRHPRNRRKMAVLAENGKRAVTSYRVLACNGDVTLLQVRIETGRTHQIRVHFAHLNHPVLGDALYGGKQTDLDIDAPRQMLHAWKLMFPHPKTGMMREYMAPLPRDFCDVLEVLGMPLIAGCSDPPSLAHDR